VDTEDDYKKMQAIFNRNAGRFRQN